jgi:zinc protease
MQRFGVAPAALLMVLAWLLSAGAAQAQTPAAPPAAASAPAAQTSTPSPPTAQQVFEHYAQVIGGRAAWEKLTSRVSRGTVHIEGIEGTGTLLVYERAPNQDLSVMTLQSGYVLRDGFDGKAGWEQDLTGKVKELQGAREADRKALADFYSEIDLAKIYPHPKMIGQKTADGRLAYVVEACVPGGRQRLLYFDAESGLLFRTDLFEDPLSPTPTTVERQDDYRDVDGIKYPYRGSLKGSGVNIQFRITTLHHNVTVTDDEVARPANSSN